MPTNPYATYLGELDPVTVIAATSSRLRGLFEKLGPAGEELPLAPGKWSARQILCHLADCEIVFAYRLRQALAEDHHVVQPFDQDEWARNYGAYDTATAMAVFTSVRQWNLGLIGSQPAESMNKVLTHPERGDMTFRTVIETMAGHDLNHLGQIASISER